ncbi:MAG: Hydrolase, TatD family [Candidatus Magasanikbacteria bacterium GW2011_GWA2_56_11]|uniref:Hydrolase, TatD family n=1 Tax=Candidatus Magasanikbacteria bacterium GW2011_GWA2_56_11 TaxID=1619044 RepID=A0A0G1YEY0_9BACT|nr:MAG: Hydrolase, TatD family [Candidatus Magasanikbacteria bacterium GW2011_GWA2_56_11]
MIIDTHCHIQFRGLDTDREAVIARGRQKGLILNLVGTQKDTSRRAVELSRQHPDMYATIGTHPNHLFPTHIDEEESHFMSREEDFDEEYYGNLYQTAPNKIIGVGETGLDLYHLPADIPLETILSKQKEVFVKHVNFALKYGLALVIHVREAHEQMIELLASLPALPRATVHCYTGNWALAQKYLDFGFYIGFTGVITFPPKKLDPAPQLALLEAVEKIPLERVVVETDAPYLAPQAYRGQRSEPWMTAEVIKKIAAVRGLDYAAVEQAVFENSLRLFAKIKVA